MVEFCRDTGGFAADPAAAADRLTSTEDTDVSTVIQEVTREGLRGFDPLPAQRTDRAGT
jgi:hypothetical protein